MTNTANALTANSLPLGIEVARNFVNREVNYKFSELEKYWLAKFFSNNDKNIFAFYPSVPDPIISYAIARYSRIKNARGLKGILLEEVIPYWIVAQMPAFKHLETKEIVKLLKEKDVKSVEDIHDEPKLEYGAYLAGTQILKALGDPLELAKLSSAGKLKNLFNTYVEGYGHNSIVRTGNITICIENISILSAKTLEWCRFTAPIELSTRFVDFTEKLFYPIHREIASYSSVASNQIENHIKYLFETYGRLMESGENSFSSFLRDLWEDKIPQGFDLNSAILGEICDVAGNALSNATLTSLGLSVSGEGLSDVIRHLYLDGSAENYAIAECIISEVEKIGAGSYIRHIESASEWRTADWSYLNHYHDFRPYFSAESRRSVEKKLFNQFESTLFLSPCYSLGEVLESLSNCDRKPYDKLPHQFESVNVLMRDLISFRTFRDLQRHTLSTTSRSLVTPLLGFYKYPKPAPNFLNGTFGVIKQADFKLWQLLRNAGISVETCQYVLAMGHNVVFEMSHNLRQHELVVKTRSRFDVNDEARSWMLKFEQKVRKRYPWYSQLSRADMTKHYVFARGANEKKGILPPAL